MLALAGMVVFSGCSNDDEDPAPATTSCSISKSYSLTVGSTTGQDAKSDEVAVTNSTGCVNLKFEVASPSENLQRFKVELSSDGENTNPVQVSGYDYSTDTKLHTIKNKENNLFTTSFDVNVSTNATRVTDTYTITFFTDNAGTKVGATATVTLKYGTAPLPLRDILTRTLTGDKGTLTPSNGQFLVSSTGVQGGSGSAAISPLAGSVDIAYQSGESGGEFVSPASKTNKGTLTGLTVTNFGTTDLNAENATADQLNSAAAPSGNSVTVVNGGKYIFKNAAGKKGLIKVTAFTAGEDGEVTFKYVVQQ